MKKVLISVPNDSLGGSEQYLKMIAAYYLAEGYEVFVLFLKRRLTGAWEDLPRKNLYLLYSSADTEKKGLYFGVSTLFKLRKYHFDYIYTSHVHLTSLTGVFIQLGIIRKHHFVARESTSIFIRFKGTKLFIFRSMYKIGYNQVNVLICQTEYMKVQLIKALPYLAQKVIVIPNPINLNLSKDKAKHSLTKQEAIDLGNYIVSAGRLIPEKGFDILIQSFKEIKKEYKNLKLVILGEGVERIQLMELSTGLNLDNDIIFRGFVDNVYPYFKNAQLCVVSSRIEGFPNVLLQMMSQNTKVVSTICAGDIDKLQGIFTCEANNAEELAKTILLCLNTDTSDRRLVFDTELEKRSINKFVEIGNKYLNEK